MDRLQLSDLAARHAALNFLFPVKFAPLFGNNWVQVTKDAAKNVASVFGALVQRGEPPARARRFCLQSVLAMFAEDIGLLPKSLLVSLVDECRRGASSYDLLGGLFRQMNEATPARGGRYAGVRYFNGGLFNLVEAIELTPGEAALLLDAAKEDWSGVQPVIFGTLFETFLGLDERGAAGTPRLGAHFTYESEIQKIVRPTIVRPWDERIAAARTVDELLELLRLFAQDKRQFARVGLASGISPKQCFGLDINETAVEVAKITLMLARRLAQREAEVFWDDHRDALPGGQTQTLQFEDDLPLDKLDDNIRCADALFTPWPAADAIIGNPPFLGSRYLAKEHGYDYVRKVHAAFPSVPKMADFCVHWFRLAHDNLKPDGRAGLVGTNSIRQNDSREASLDYVLKSGGVITEAVSTQVWSGDAAVHVSIVNWVKLPVAPEGQPDSWLPRLKKLFTQLGDNKSDEWKCEDLESIGATLASSTSVTDAKQLNANKAPKRVYVGQYPFNEGFWLTPLEAGLLLRQDPDHREILFPYMIGRDLVELGQPTRWSRLSNRWWQLRDYQPGTMAAISGVSRYIAASRVTKRPIFEFISPGIHPDNTLVVFPMPDDYSFGMLQSGIHWAWFQARCSTLGGTFRYTSDTVFNTFPWPQFEACRSRREEAQTSPGAPGQDNPGSQSLLTSAPTALIRAVAEAARALRALRRGIMTANGWSLRDLYRTLETPGSNRLRAAHATLDAAVRAAYGMEPDADTLAFLLNLNHELAAQEARGEPIRPPGLPAGYPAPETLVTEDCIQVSGP